MKANGERIERDSGLKAQAAPRLADLGILRDMKANGERKGPEGRPSKVSQASTLTDLGLTRDDSSRWQKIAEIPTAQFESVIEETKEAPRIGSARPGRLEASNC